jgi:hypothetical protein
VQELCVYPEGEVTVHGIDSGLHKNNKKLSDGKLDESHYNNGGVKID